MEETTETTELTETEQKMLESIELEMEVKIMLEIE